MGRESPLYFAERLTEHLGGAKIYLKREDLNHTGAHKINNCLGQILLARRMGKTRIIAETGAGQHGVATATVAARFGLPCTVYMGEVDMERQKPNVFRMRLLGAEVKGVSSGSRTLKDATNEALRDWVANVHDTFYIIGSVVGPHPYPAHGARFPGGDRRRDARPDAGPRKAACPIWWWPVSAAARMLRACSMRSWMTAAMSKFMAWKRRAMASNTPRHAATISKGTPGVLHGARSYLLQDADGQIAEAHSISAGLDYPGIGPEHSWLKDIGRVKYHSVTDREALDAFMLLSKLEGIIPALEPAHAIAHVAKIAGQMKKDQIIAVCLSGRGDKDIFSVAAALGEKL